MTTPTTSGLLFERPEPGVLLITINRPEKLNAADEELHEALGQVWVDVARDPETRVVVITGAGRAFSAGRGHRDGSGGPTVTTTA